MVALGFALIVILILIGIASWVFYHVNCYRWIISHSLSPKDQSKNKKDLSDTIACEPSIVQSARLIDDLWRRANIDADHNTRMECRDQMREETLGLVRHILAYKLKVQADEFNGQDVVVLAQRRNVEKD